MGERPTGSELKKIAIPGAAGRASAIEIAVIAKHQAEAARTVVRGGKTVDDGDGSRGRHFENRPEIVRSALVRGTVKVAIAALSHLDSGRWVGLTGEVVEHGVGLSLSRDRCAGESEDSHRGDDCREHAERAGIAKTHLQFS